MLAGLLAPVRLAAQQLTEAPGLAAPGALVWETTFERAGGTSPLLHLGVSRWLELRLTSGAIGGVKVSLHPRLAVIATAGEEPSAAIAWSAPLPLRVEMQSNCIFATDQTVHSLALLRPVAAGWTGFAELYRNAPGAPAWVANGGAMRGLGRGTQIELGAGRELGGGWFARAKLALEIRVRQRRR